MPTDDSQTSSGRQYIRIQPTTDSLSVESVTTQFTRLHRLLTTDDDRSWSRRLVSKTDPEPRTLEWLFAASPAGRLEYYVGLPTSDDEADADRELESLEGLLRNLFPDSYELDRCSFDLDEFLGLRPLDERTTEELARRSDASADDPPTDENQPLETHIGTVEYRGVGDRRADWQTRLTPYAQLRTDDADVQLPLTSVAETLATTETPVVFQVLLKPKPDWTTEADLRRRRLRRGEESFVGRLVTGLLVPTETTDEPRDLPAEVQRRLDELDEKETRHSFSVNARAVAVTDPGQQPPRVTEELRTALESVGHSCYQLDAETHEVACYGLQLDRLSTEDVPALDLVDAVRERTFRNAPTGLQTRLPGRGRSSPELVADPREVPSFCVLGGASLTANAKRALDLTPGEQTSLSRPAPDRLTPYHELGLTLGYALTQDGRKATDPVALPPDLQAMHAVWFGKTGSGKTTSLITGILDNHGATRGPSILVEPKGDGMPVEYLRAHYATYGTLDNVYYFECADVLPALSFFDIRPQLAVGIDRATAVQDVVDHYVEVLVGIMGRDRFERAVRSPDIIRYLVKALFDPVHGSDAFTHRDLQQAATQMAETRDAPPVTDDDLAALLGGIVTNSKRSFDELLQGVHNRIEKIPVDDRLATLFNHVPADADLDSDADPRFDFFDVLDENAVVIVDTSQLRKKSRRAFTLVLLSNLWTALRRRQAYRTTDYTQHMPDRETGHRRARTETDGGPQTETKSTLPLVNLYIEEAADVASSGLMTDLLAQSRGFGLSVTLAMQFPAQVRSADTEAYAELLNNVSTIVTGNVAVDPDLETRLATAEMPPNEVGNRLRALRRGQWFVSLPAKFGEPEPRPFLVSSAPLPAGHPEGDDPLSETQALAFDALLDVVRDRTRLDHGLAVRERQRPSPPVTPNADSDSQSSDDKSSAEESSSTTAPATTRVDSALPFTKRLPTCITYDAETHAIVCADCSNRHAPTPTGIRRGIECCSSLDRVDRDEIPIADVPVTLSESEREASEYTDRQLCFLQAVYSAHQGEYDLLEYDICWDSMLRLQEYVGIESDAVQELVDADLLAIDCDHPHRLYTVTAEGRSEIQAAYREGVAYGHGVGDLGESTLHRVMVEFGYRYVEDAYVEDAESAVVEVVPYYELDGGHRLDVVGLDEEGEVRVVVEAERSNNDILRAVPDDYDKMAEFDPEDAIWITKNREGAHDVLDALNDPPTGKVRVEKTYSRSSPPQAFRLDAPGCTQIHTLRYVRETLLGLKSP